MWGVWKFTRKSRKRLGVPLEILVLRDKVEGQEPGEHGNSWDLWTSIPPTIRYNRVTHWKVYGKTQGTHGKKRMVMFLKISGMFWKLMEQLCKLVVGKTCGKPVVFPLWFKGNVP